MLVLCQNSPGFCKSFDNLQQQYQLLLKFVITCNPHVATCAYNDVCVFLAIPGIIFFLEIPGIRLFLMAMIVQLTVLKLRWILR